MKNEKETPIFYHPDDCDCIECDARRQPGGLDYDPTNDDTEFEKHEEEILEEREENKTKELTINISVKISQPLIGSYDPDANTEHINWKILNQEEIEKKIYQKFRRLIEMEFGKTVLRSGISDLIQFPISMAVRK